MRLQLSCLVLFSCLFPFTGHASGPASVNLPLVFEQNMGQVSGEYSFLLRRGPVAAEVFDHGITFTLPSKDGTASSVRFELIDANRAVASGIDLLPGHSNYLIGADASKWIREIPQYSRVQLEQVYPGISLVFYGSNLALEHDFVVQPGADPSKIAFRLKGIDKAYLNANGEFASGGATQFILRKPVAYQMRSGRRVIVEAAFIEDGDGVVRFRLGSYDKSQELIIDPVFSFSTYLGGTGTDHALAVGTDATGNVYVTGSTTSTDFPISKAEQPQLAACSGSCQDAFVAKLDPTGSTLLFSTYLGGPWNDTGEAIAADANGNIIVGGVTGNSGFPQSGEMQSVACSGNADCFFLVSLKPDGSAFNYAGEVGGGQDLQYTQIAMALDASGNAFLTGVTWDSNFQITPGTLVSSWSGYPNQALFVLKVDTQGKLVYSTLIPATAANTAGTPNNLFWPGGIVVDATGRATVSGSAGPGLPTTAGAIGPDFPNSPIYSNSSAAFALRLNATATAIDFGTYLPGTDIGGGLVLDKSGNFFITGASHETGLPVGSNPYQSSPGATGTCYCNAGFILKLNSQGTGIFAATYLNGKTASYPSDPYTVLSDIVLDSSGNPYVAGATDAVDFPLQNPIVSNWENTGESSDMVLAGMSADLSSLIFGSFLNSSAGVYYGSYLGGIAMDGTNHLSVAGYTVATDFPTTSGSVEPTLPPPANPQSSPQHGFVSRIDLSAAGPGVCLSPSSIDFGTVTALTTHNVSITVTNCGTASLHVTSITSSDPTVAANGSCGTIAAKGTCTVQANFTPRTSGQISGALSFVDDAVTSPQVLPFTGLGSAPRLVSDSGSSVDFGRLIVGTSGPATTLVLQNAGNALLSISSVAVTGASFRLVNNGCTTTLAAGGLCAVQVAFSPQSAGSLSGALTVSSNDPLTPHFSIPLSGIGDTAYVSPILSSIATPTVQINAGSQKITVLGADFYPGSVIQVNGVAQPTTFDSNGQLDAQVDSSILKTIGELPVTVFNPAPGGGASGSLPLTPYQSIPMWAGALIYEPVSKLLYAAVPDGAPANADTIIPIDPTTGTTLTPIAVGKDPNTLAVSADGKYLFVALAGDHAIQRINLSTRSIEKTYSLPSDPSFGLLRAQHMEVVPGTSTSIVVSLNRQASPPEDGAAMFNDAGLVNYISNDYSNNYLGIDSFTFTSSGTTIYGLPFPFIGNTQFFATVNVSPSGLSVPTEAYTPGPLQTTGSLVASDGTLLYTNLGGVWDPSTQKLVATLSPPGGASEFYASSVIPDSSTSRIYYFDNSVTYDQAGTIAVEAFNGSDHSFINDLAFSAFYSPQVTDLARWGTNGFAFRDFDGTLTNPKENQVVIFRSGIVGNQSYPTPTVTAILPASVDVGSSAFTLQVDGAGFGVQSTITWNGSALPTTYVNSAEVTAEVPASLLVSSGTAQIVVKNPAPGGSSTSLLLTIGNDASTLVLSANALQFGNVVQGDPSSTQVVTITNDGPTIVQINGVSATGDYSFTNGCGSSLVPSASCQISVVFTPGAVGDRPGTLTVADSSPRGYEAISLSGTGLAALSFSTPAGGSTSATIASGATATYNLTATAANGFSGTVSFTCSGAPQYASCSVSPGSSNLGSGASAAVTVTVSTQTTVTAAVQRSSQVTVAGLGGLVLLSLPLVILRGRKARRLMQVLCLACAFAAMNACGGGGGGAGTKTTVEKTPPGTYTLTLKGAAGQSSASQTITLIVQ